MQFVRVFFVVVVFECCINKHDQMLYYLNVFVSVLTTHRQWIHHLEENKNLRLYSRFIRSWRAVDHRQMI